MSAAVTAVCGVWPTARRLVAVVQREGRTGAAASIARTAEAQWAFVTWLLASGVRVLVTTEVLAGDTLVATAIEAELEVYLTPTSLVDGVRAAAALTHRGPRHTAALLARWPGQPVLRQHMRPVRPAARDRQLHLW